MKYLSVKEYAIKYRLPIYSVVKMARSGELDAQLRDVDGKKEYVIFNTEAPKLQKSDKEEIIDYKKAYFELRSKYDALLKKMV